MIGTGTQNLGVYISQISKKYIYWDAISNKTIIKTRSEKFLNEKNTF